VRSLIVLLGKSWNCILQYLYQPCEQLCIVKTLSIHLTVLFYSLQLA